VAQLRYRPRLANRPLVYAISMHFKAKAKAKVPSVYPAISADLESGLTSAISLCSPPDINFLHHLDTSGWQMLASLNERSTSKLLLRHWSMVELETVPPSAPTQTNAKTSENKAFPANPVPVTLRRGTTRRRGACGMCKLKKVRCE
jgi:hypothetical protein